MGERYQIHNVVAGDEILASTTQEQDQQIYLNETNILALQNDQANIEDGVVGEVTTHVDSVAYKSSIAAQVPGVKVLTVSGTTPTISGEANTRYLCGTITNLTINPPSNGIMIVRFTPQYSPIQVTITGATITWPEWFELENITDGYTYEIYIEDALYGGVAIWPNPL